MFFSAIATAIPNGHLIGNDVLPMRPVYPRTQYTNSIPPHPYSSTPRVNAGDLSQPSSGMCEICTIQSGHLFRRVDFAICTAGAAEDGNA